MIDRHEKIARLRLIRAEKLGVSKYWELMERFKSARLAVNAVVGQYNLPSSSEIEDEVFATSSLNAYFVFFEDELYPPLLREVASPPPVLVFRGNASKVKNAISTKLMLTVVGARNCSISASQFAAKLVEQMVEQDIVVVSGMAAGIDTVAHRSSLSHCPIAVLAGGIEHVYPYENKALYYKIIENGGLYTQMPYKSTVTSSNFPRRNRIMAGMSHATLLIEAAHKSGSLITAKYAMEYSRDVCVVPSNPLDGRGDGGNDLLKQGALLVDSVDDIINNLAQSALGFYHTKQLSEAPVKETEQPVARPEQSVKRSTVSLKEIEDYIGADGTNLETLLSELHVSPQNLLISLLKLELAGRIKRAYSQRVYVVQKNSAYALK